MHASFTCAYSAPADGISFQALVLNAVLMHGPAAAGLHASTAHYYCGPIARLFPAWVRSKYQQLLSYEGEVDAEGRPDGYAIFGLSSHSHCSNQS